MEDPSHFQPTYEHKHWHLVLFGLLFVFAIIAGGFVYVEYFQAASGQNSQVSIATTTPQSKVDPELVAKLLDPNSYKYDLTLRDGSVHTDWIPDVATLVKLDEWFYADKDYIYSTNPQTSLLDRLVYADRLTFTVFPGNGEQSEWARDKNHVFDFYEVVKGADQNTFKVFPPDNVYALSGTTLFYSTANQYLGLYQSYEGVDPSTLQVLSDGYAKDKNNMYFKSLLLEGVEPATVSLLDKTNELVGEKAGRYIADTHSVFFVHEGFVGWDISYLDPIPPLAEKVIGADPITFTPVSGNSAYDAQDKNHKYLQGQIVE